MALNQNLAAAGVTVQTLIQPGQRAVYYVNGDFTGTVQGEIVDGSSASVAVNEAGAAVSGVDDPFQGVIVNAGPTALHFRFRALAGITGTAYCYVVDLPSTIDPIVSGVVGSGVVCVDRQRRVNVTRLVFGNTPLTLADATQGGGTLVYSFPAESVVAILGAVGRIEAITTSAILTTLNGSKTLQWGLGTAVQSTGDLATTQQNVIPKTEILSSATIDVLGAGAESETVGTVAQLSGVGAGSVGLYLNVGVPLDTDIDADATILLSGFVEFVWVHVYTFGV